MVIVRLIGGLGNQLFQYAMARRVAYMNGVPLKIDATPFSSYKLHKYSLSPFNISADFATPDEIAGVKCSKGFTGMRQRVSALFHPYYQRPVVKERTFHFDPDIFNISGNAYLQGYWQSEAYFREIEDLIRQEFTIKPKPEAVNMKTAEMIANSNAISLHVRRGDYVTDSKAKEVYCACSLEYYQEAIELIARQVKNPHFFIFSDDPVWAQANICIQYETSYVTNNDAGRNYEDMRLMSLCQHHIIANSSFSWWGAWLNPNPEKIVIAPKKWFSIDIDTKDLLPQEWVKL